MPPVNGFSPIKSRIDWSLAMVPSIIIKAPDVLISAPGATAFSTSAARPTCKPKTMSQISAPQYPCAFNSFTASGKNRGFYFRLTIPVDRYGIVTPSFLSPCRFDIDAICIERQRLMQLVGVDLTL